MNTYERLATLDCYNRTNTRIMFWLIARGAYDAPVQATQNRIAHDLGVRRQHVNRGLAQLLRAGAIESHRMDGMHRAYALVNNEEKMP